MSRAGPASSRHRRPTADVRDARGIPRQSNDVRSVIAASLRTHLKAERA